MRKQRYSDLANKLKPYLRQAAPALIIAGGSGDGGGPHVHSFEELSGELLEEQAPWVVEGLAGLKPHGITDPVFHNVIGAQYSVVGLTATDSLGLLESTSDGNADHDTLLRSGAMGELAIGELTASTVARLGALTDTAVAGFAHAAALATPAIEQASDGGTKLGAAVGQSIDFWIDESRYAALSGNELRLFPDTRMQTDNFVSQLTGWRHTYAGELDTRFIQADQLKIRRLIADLQQALAGSQIISKSVTTLAHDFVAPRPGGGAFLIVDDLPSAEGMAVLEDGDTVRVSKFSRADGGVSATDCWGVVTDYFDELEKKQRWFFTRYGDFGLEVPTMTGPLQTANDNDTTLTVTKVTGTVSGNLSIACVLVESTTVVTTPPEDWETITTATVTGMRATIYKKTTDGSEPSTYTWTHSSNVDSMVILLNYTNQDPDAAVSAYISNPNDSTAAFSVIKSLTPVSNTDLYLGFVAVRANRNPIVQPDGWSLLTTWTAGGNTLAAMTTLVDGYAGLPFGDVSADLTGGTAHTISFTIDIIPKPIPLDLETGLMAIGDTVAPGAFVLDYGVSGNGWHEITAIDGIYGENSPYSRVVSWEDHPATGAVLRTQDGNLNGIFGEGPEWGFYAGNGVGLTSQYLRLSSLGAKLNNIDIELYHDANQTVLIGANGQDVWFGTSLLDKRLSWNGVNLAVKGSVTIDNPSGFTGSGYLQIGSGIKDSTLDGFNFDANEIVGQLDGVDQVVMGTDGKVRAGGGNVVLAADGISVIGDTYLRLYQDSSTLKGYLYSSNPLDSLLVNSTGIGLKTNGAATTESVALRAKASGGRSVELAAEATGSSGTNRLRALVYSGSASTSSEMTLSESVFSLAIGNTGVTDFIVNAAGYVGIGATDPSANLQVARGTGPNGAAVFMGTDFASHFSYATDEHTYIRGGKSTSKVVINDTSSGTVEIAAGGGATTFGGSLGTAWANLSFGSGWGNLGSGWQAGQYKKIGDMVFLRGFVVRTSGSSARIATLPSGYRPPAPDRWAVTSDAGLHATIQVDTDGNVDVAVGSPDDYMTLSGIVFSTI